MTPLQTGAVAVYTFAFSLKYNLANDGYLIIGLPTGVVFTGTVGSTFSCPITSNENVI